MNSTAQHAHDLIVAASPADFEAMPLYVVAACELSEETQRSLFHDCVGIASPVMDIVLRPELERLGRWRGHGHAIAVGIEPTDVERFVEVALHEASHAATHRIAPGASIEPADVPEWMQPQAVLSRWSLPASTDAPAWHGHGAEFIRAACHLAWRARCTALPRLVAGDIGVAGPRYGLSPAPFYASTLGDEVRERRNEPIGQIIRSDPPAEFSRLWNWDMELHGALAEEAK